jgi:hypothetical protein
MREERGERRGGEKREGGREDIGVEGRRKRGKTKKLTLLASLAACRSSSTVPPPSLYPREFLVIDPAVIQAVLLCSLDKEGEVPRSSPDWAFPGFLKPGEEEEERERGRVPGRMAGEGREGREGSSL